MQLHRFSVFWPDRRDREEAGRWRAFVVGADGKQSPADFIVPEFVGEEELEQYLADLFHEYATTRNPDVRRLD